LEDEYKKFSLQFGIFFVGQSRTKKTERIKNSFFVAKPISQSLKAVNAFYRFHFFSLFHYWVISQDN
jgi:hypothetical protein